MKKLSIFFLGFLLTGSGVYASSVTKDSALTTQGTLDTHKSPIKTIPGAPAPSTSYTSSAPKSKVRTFISNKSSARGSFVIQHIKVKGNSVYTSEFISGFLSHLLGKSATEEEITKGLENLVAHYWRDGYVLAEVRVSIKDLQDKDQKITLHINEGFISEVKVEGGNAAIRSLINSYVQLLQRTRPFRMDMMEYYDNLLKSYPGLTIEGDVYNIPENLGEGGILFKISKRRVQPYLSIDNRGSEYSGPMRMAAGGSAGSVFRMGDLTSALLTLTPNNDELRYGQLSHVTPIGSDGSTLSLRGDYGETKPGFIIGDRNIKGRIYYLEAFYSKLAYTFKDQQINWRVGMEALGYDAKVPTDLLYRDNLRTLIAGASTSFKDFLKARNILDAKLSQGINAFGTSNLMGDRRSIENGKAVYTKVFGEWTRSQPLVDALSLVTRVRGQYSVQSLLAGAQFTCGGEQYLSGYDPGDFRGDRGLAGRAELRYGFEPGEDYPIHKGHFYLFYDAGKVWNRSAQRSTNPISSASGTSTGVGTRVTYLKNFGINLELSKPLTHRLPSRVPFPLKRQHPWRVFFKVEWRP